MRLSVDARDHNPALLVVVPDGPEDDRGSKVLFPEHLTVRAHGQSPGISISFVRARRAINRSGQKPATRSNTRGTLKESACSRAPL